MLATKVFPMDSKFHFSKIFQTRTKWFFSLFISGTHAVGPFDNLHFTFPPRNSILYGFMKNEKHFSFHLSTFPLWRINITNWLCFETHNTKLTLKCPQTKYQSIAYKFPQVIQVLSKKTFWYKILFVVERGLFCKSQV